MIDAANVEAHALQGGMTIVQPELDLTNNLNGSGMAFDFYNLNFGSLFDAAPPSDNGAGQISPHDLFFGAQETTEITDMQAFLNSLSEEPMSMDYSQNLPFANFLPM